MNLFRSKRLGTLKLNRLNRAKRLEAWVVVVYLGSKA